MGNQPPPSFLLGNGGGKVGRRLLLVGLFALSVLYLSIGSRLTLEWMDEGMIVYPAWRVAEGDLPYRDFQHLYGPSLHFLNGALLHLFGNDLGVLRVSLVLLKALTSVLVFLLSRRVARPAVALSMSVIFLAVWGTPVWVFNSPYANHYGLPLCLAAFLVHLSLRSRRSPSLQRLGLVVAGLLLGLALTFKQTLGVFYALVFVLGLMLDERARRSAGPQRERESAVAQLAAASILLGAVGLCLAYFGKHLTSATSITLIVPMLVAIAVVAAAELRPPRAGAALLARLLPLGLGVAVPLTAYALVFLAAHALGSLAFNMFAGLPQLIDWWVPLPAPRLQTLLLAAGMAALVGLAHALARGSRPGTTAWSVVLTGVPVLIVVAVLAGMRFSMWQLEVLDLLRWVPLVLVWGTAWPILSRAARSFSVPDVAFLWLLSAGSVLQLHPAADLPHVVAILPALLPLLAYLVDRYLASGAEGRAGRGRSTYPALIMTVLAAVLVVPPVQLLVRSRLARPQPLEGFARATGIWSDGPVFPHAVELVRFLEASDAGPLFVLADQQMLYFLAGRNSALPMAEHVLYYVGAGLLSDEKARMLVPEERTIERLRAARPLIVDAPKTKASQNFRRAFPAVARYIDDAYAPLRTFGDYQLLAPRGGPP